MGSPISFEMKVRQQPGNIESNMGGDKVMMNINNGKYYNLGSIGGRIWELVKNPITVQQVVSELIAEYDVGQVECEQQVLSFLDHLYDEGLIDFAEGEEQWALPTS